MRTRIGLPALLMSTVAACATADDLPLGGPFVMDGGSSVTGIDAGSSTDTGIVIVTGATGTGAVTGAGTTTATGAGGGTTSAAGSSAGTKMSVPTTCAESDGTTGCCVGNTRYYCSGSTVASDDCTAVGRMCGWSSKYENYGCVDSAGSDPSGAAPMACGGTTGTGGGGTGGGSSSTGGGASSTGGEASSTSSASGSASVPTWTYLYSTYLAVGTAGDCNGSCHHHSECSSPSACYSWIGSRQLSGGGGLLSWDEGYMPPGGPSSDPQAETAFTAWTAAGAQDD